METKLNGKTFCITGVLSIGRKEITEIITKNGGKVGGACTSKTNYLVVGDDPGANKLAEAEKHGTPIIDEEELMDMI